MFLPIVFAVVAGGILVQLVILSRLYVYQRIILAVLTDMYLKLGCGSQTTPQENGEHSP